MCVCVCVCVCLYQYIYLPIAAIEEELSRAEFLETLRDMVELVGKNNTDQQHDALSFEYSYWPNIHNGTQNRKTFLDVCQQSVR